jgi:DNA polymerase III delta prime subunit
MNLQENIHRIKEMMGILTEEEQKSYSEKNRIILIGPPTVGKSTVAEELSNQLGIEYVKLDKLQEKIGYGEGKEFELIQQVLSPDFKKYNTPSILDFGGGHVYNKGVKELLNDYPNVFLLMPSQDSKTSDELLRKGNTKRWTDFMDQIIQGLKSGKHKHTKEKELELIDKLERMRQGEGGKFDKKDLPDVPEMEGWGGLNMDKDWNKFVPLSKEEDVKNRDIAKHIISVYDNEGNRRDKSEIAKDIIKLI